MDLEMPPLKVKEYCNVAGFTHVRKLPLDNPFNLLYEVRLVRNYFLMCHMIS